ncbi:AGE family epimerase/isomerase [Neiella sp. HB171785]|uniref:AGE family epimerase/isomerase n=1 Tax=Neiella litorisoli TaxID=2771431 RepID=A0A8J6UIP6_9GAMM|nr:AGE family epimerase/isomerase [Neiella litorisoli]MBD1388773.1 AGE family epimerase/isomerase [Neiella litorisoli]
MVWQSLLLVSMLLWSGSVQSAPLEQQASAHVDQLLAFHTAHPVNWQQHPQAVAYFSELDNQGKPISDKVYTVALSRLIYGLAYQSADNPANLAKAKAAASFQLQHMLGEDRHGQYFLSWVSESGQDNSTRLDIWQQSYGLCGLVELYRQTGDQQLLQTIHRLHEALVSRFQDQQYGGFWGAYELIDGPEKGSKSLQSLMYPVTAYLANLWLADAANRASYQAILQQHIELLAQIGWNQQQQWVNVEFDDQWQPCESTEEAVCSAVSPGHNFQLAALLLRASDWPFIGASQQLQLRSRGDRIITATLAKPIYGQNGIAGGFARSFEPLSNEVVDSRKAWWQHCEAIIALSLLPAQRANRDLLLAFFLAHFQDQQFGGEYFFVDADNQPVTKELKGSIGKSAYHSVEMVRFL